MFGGSIPMAANKTTTLRLRRVKFKSGGSLEIMRAPRAENLNAALMASAERACEDASVEAFSLVGWRTDGSVYVNYRISDKSSIVAGQIPSLVRDVLVAEVAGRWVSE